MYSEWVLIIGELEINDLMFVMEGVLFVGESWMFYCLVFCVCGGMWMSKKFLLKVYVL